MTPDDEAWWRLEAVIEEAGAQLCGAEAQLLHVEEKLRRSGAIIARIRVIASKLGIDTSAPEARSAGACYMSVEAFADHMGWSVRRMRDVVRQRLVEGEHFHRNGRRFVVHTEAAESLLRTISSHTRGNKQERTMVIDEVTRRRAHEALKKGKQR